MLTFFILASLCLPCLAFFFGHENYRKGSFVWTANVILCAWFWFFAIYGFITFVW